MCPERYWNRQRGAGLPIAIFVITALALIVTSMAQQQESSGAAISQQILSQRAFYAAESGAQAAVTEALYGSGCDLFPDLLTFTEAGLSGCRADLACDTVLADIDGDGTDEPIHTITSTGQCGAGAEASQRIVEVRVR